MQDNTITVVGNLTRDVDYKFSNNGNGYTRGGVAVNRRKKVGEEYVEETSFFDFVVLDGQQAENVAESMQKGDRVVIVGWLQQRTVEGDDGEKRYYHTIVADEVSPSTRWAKVLVTKNPKAEKTGTSAGQPDPFEDF